MSPGRDAELAPVMGEPNCTSWGLRTPFNTISSSLLILSGPSACRRFPGLHCISHSRMFSQSQTHVTGSLFTMI